MPFIIDKVWYGKSALKWLLWPLSMIYRVVIGVRRWYLQKFKQLQCSVPIIVVGNITVGGVGKTPLVIELAKKIQDKGLKVGIVSRGYGAKINRFPHEVQLSNSATDVGDEPLIIARKTKCPVVIAPDRTAAIQYLLEHHDVQIIISDDGLQHYRMGRAVELAVIDGMRGLGNRLCLPAGPLRESVSRLKQVDFIIVNEGFWENAYPMTLIPGKVIKMTTMEELGVDELLDEVAAVAGIGNPP